MPGAPGYPHTSNLWQISLILGDVALLAVGPSQQLSLDELSFFLFSPLPTKFYLIISYTNILYSGYEKAQRHSISPIQG